MPGAELVVFEHSTRLTHLEEPKPYLQALRDFLRSLDLSIKKSASVRASGPSGVCRTGSSACASSSGSMSDSR